jgi:hypothetical protein
MPSELAFLCPTSARLSGWAAAPDGVSAGSGRLTLRTSVALRTVQGEARAYRPSRPRGKRTAAGCRRAHAAPSRRHRRQRGPRNAALHGVTEPRGRQPAPPARCLGNDQGFVPAYYLLTSRAISGVTRRASVTADRKLRFDRLLSGIHASSAVILPITGRFPTLTEGFR